METAIGLPRNGQGWLTGGRSAVLWQSHMEYWVCLGPFFGVKSISPTSMVPGRPTSIGPTADVQTSRDEPHGSWPTPLGEGGPGVGAGPGGVDHLLGMGLGAQTGF